MPLDRPLALTQGDPAGIGPDITLTAWLKRGESGLPPFIYLGDPAILAARARLMGLSVPLREVEPAAASETFSQALPVYPIAAGAEIAPGEPHVATAQSTISAIETAVTLTLQHQTAAVVTNPIAKSVLYEGGFGFPGHTELLADLATRATGNLVRPVMMLAGPKLRAASQPDLPSAASQWALPAQRAVPARSSRKPRLVRPPGPAMGSIRHDA